MLRALLYLRLTSLRNRVRVQLQRLRQPKYLLGTIFVVAYFWFFFFRHSGARGVTFGGANPFALPGDLAPLFTALGALALSVAVILMWLLPDEAPGVKFSEAEIAFLFPAPLSRRSLIHFKVASLQLSSLLQSCFFTLLFNHRTLFQGHTLRTIVSWWVILSFVRLHYLGASLSLAWLRARGVSVARRRLVIAGLTFALLSVATWTLFRELAAGGPHGSLADAFDRAVRTGPLHWLLWPAARVVAPFFAASAGGFALALGAAVVVLVAHYFWVVRVEVSFEDASLVQAERQAARLTELRTTGNVTLGQRPRTGRRPPFNLARARWPEFAFLWKNLLSTIRPWFTAGIWLRCAGTLVLLSVALQQFMGTTYWKAGGAIAAVGMMAMGLALFYGPLLTRLDLRQDLANTDILRTYPLPGWRILLGELLAPIVVLTGIIWLGLLAWYLGLYGHQPPALSEEWFSPSMRLVLAGVVAFLTPFVVALQLLVPNGAVIFFPAMFRATQTPGPSLDLMGQRMLFGFGQIFILALVFVPAMILTISSLLMLRGSVILRDLIGLMLRGSVTLDNLMGTLVGAEPSLMVTMLFGGAVLALVLTGEIWCGIWWLGGRFERFDLSQELHA